MKTRFHFRLKSKGININIPKIQLKVEDFNVDFSTKEKQINLSINQFQLIDVEKKKDSILSDSKEKCLQIEYKYNNETKKEENKENENRNNMKIKFVSPTIHIQPEFINSVLSTFKNIINKAMIIFKSSETKNEMNDKNKSLENKSILSASERLKSLNVPGKRQLPSQQLN